MKKILIIGLVIVLSLGVIGCDQDEEDNNDLTVENDADEVVGDFIKVSETGDSNLLGSILDQEFKSGNIVVLIQRYEDYEEEYDNFEEFEDEITTYITDEAEYSYNNEDIEVDYEQEKIIVYDERIEEDNNEKEVLDELSDEFKKAVDELEVSNIKEENSKKIYFLDFTYKPDDLIFDVLEDQFIIELEIVDNHWVIKDLIIEMSTIVEPSDFYNIYNIREDEEDEVTDEQYFEFDSDTGTITDYDKEGGSDVVIPSEINGVDVTKIGEGAFISAELTSIKFPNSLTEIGNWPFSDNKLEVVEIPNSVYKIGDWAFHNNELEKVKLGDSVIKISEGAFNNNALIEVEIPDNIEEIDEDAFDEDVELINWED